MARVWKFGDDVNTDEIIPARYLNTSDDAELARHCMEDAEGGAAFIKGVSPGDVIVAGRNFGCGSSREHAPRAIRSAGVAAVVAESFARIFFRNAINTGLAIFECPEAAKALKAGDEIEVDPAAGRLASSGRNWTCAPYPPAIRKIIAAGGLMPYVRDCTRADRA